MSDVTAALIIAGIVAGVVAGGIAAAGVLATTAELVQRRRSRRARYLAAGAVDTADSFAAARVQVRAERVRAQLLLLRAAVDALREEGGRAS